MLCNAEKVCYFDASSSIHHAPCAAYLDLELKRARDQRGLSRQPPVPQLPQWPGGLWEVEPHASPQEDRLARGRDRAVHDGAILAAGDVRVEALAIAPACLAYTTRRGRYAAFETTKREHELSGFLMCSPIHKGIT